MSAVNIAVLPGRAVIFTDGAHYDAEGRLVLLGDKVATTPAGLAVAGRGNSFFAPFMAKRLARGGWTIDEIEEDGGEVIEENFAAVRGLMLAGSGQDRNDIFVVGWSAAAGTAKLARWSNCAPAGAPRFAMVSDVVAPDLSDAGWDRAKRAILPIGPDRERACLELLKAQRFEVGAEEFGCAGQFLIGGYIQRTEVTAQGIRKSIVHRWEEDRVGEKIRPHPHLDPVAHPNAVPLNRAERRRQAKRGKAVA